jgi:CelD/BcsL family acetyltransferase involved in cellulose biosynthesis
MNTTAYFWGGASWRSRQIPPANEALIWEAMRYWRGRGVKALDLGAGDYKRKFGVRDVAVPHLVHSSRPGLGAMRALVKVLRTSERLRRFVRTARFRGRQAR